MSKQHKPRKPKPARVVAMVRFSLEMRDRIDRAAQRLGISRTAFINTATAEKLERMEI